MEKTFSLRCALVNSSNLDGARVRLTSEKNSWLKGALVKSLKFCAAASLLLNLVVACASTSTEALKITRKDGSEVTLKVEIAKTNEERAKGFMGRTKIPDGTGMLFVFDSEQVLSFWMKNTPTALSIAYIDRAGIIKEIHDMKPYSLESITSNYSCLYALEVPKGWFSRANIQIGDKITY